MPVSDIGSLPGIMQEVALLNPAGIIELGVGFGKIGVLCREVLEAVHGRCHEDTWQSKVIGIEGFESYRNPCWNVYTDVLIKDFRKDYEEIKGWDLVMMIDSLEHCEKAEAKVILATLVKNNRHIIVSVPIGNCPQGAEFGNDFECHRSIWNGPEEFDTYQSKVLHNGVCCSVSIRGEYEK